MTTSGLTLVRIRSTVDKIQSNNVNRRSGSSLDNILSGPTAKDRVCERVAFRGWNIIGQPYRKRISNIEVGGSSVDVRIEGWSALDPIPMEPAEAVSMECDHEYEEVPAATG